MPGISRSGDLVTGGAHCHGHDHGPQPSPGRIREGSPKVFANGRPVARDGDQGYSPKCCGGVGKIILHAGQSRVFADGKPVVKEGDTTMHCDMAPGVVSTSSRNVLLADGMNSPSKQEG